MPRTQEPTVGIDSAASPNARYRAEQLLSQLQRQSRFVDGPIEWLTTDASRPILIAIPQRTPEEVATARHIAPNTHIVGICDHHLESSLCEGYLRAGVAGIVPTDETPSAVVHALAAMLDGYTVADRTVILNIAARPTYPPPPSLSTRDKQLLNLIAQGASRNHIAAATGYSQRHLRRITTQLLNKIGAATHAHAAALAVQWGLVNDIMHSPPHRADSPVSGSRSQDSKPFTKD